MAYIINPDGTISTVDANYDHNGNIKPKIDSEFLKEQAIHYNRNIEPLQNRISSSTPRTKKKKKVVKRIPPFKQKQFISKAEIDFFFKDRKCSGRRISNEEYSKILLSLPDVLKDYFVSCFLRYKGYKLSENEDFRKRKTFKKNKNNSKNKQNNSHIVRDASTIHSGFSLGEVATFSSYNKRTPEGNMVNGKSLKGASRNPKYGYARDRYGRVQERDSYNEERRNEFHNAQNYQKNYDYSNYDANDDHDGAYSDWE